MDRLGVVVIGARAVRVVREREALGRAAFRRRLGQLGVGPRVC